MNSRIKIKFQKIESIFDWLILSFLIHFTILFLILGSISCSYENKNLKKVQSLDLQFELIYASEPQDSNFISSYSENKPTIQPKKLSAPQSIQSKYNQSFFTDKQIYSTDSPKNENDFDLVQTKPKKVETGPPKTNINTSNSLMTVNSIIKNQVSSTVNSRFNAAFANKKIEDTQRKKVNENEEEITPNEEFKFKIFPGKSDSNVCLHSTIELGHDLNIETDSGDLSLRYLWAFISKPKSSKSVLSFPNTRFAKFSPDSEGTYAIGLKVFADKTSSKINVIYIKAEKLERGVFWYDDVRNSTLYLVNLIDHYNGTQEQYKVPTSGATDYKYMFKNLRKNTTYATTVYAVVKDGVDKNNQEQYEHSPLTDELQFTTCHDYNSVDDHSTIVN